MTLSDAMLAMEICSPGAPDVPGVWAGPVATAFRTALASDTPPAVCQSCALYRGTF